MSRYEHVALVALGTTPEYVCILPVVVEAFKIRMLERVCNDHAFGSGGEKHGGHLVDVKQPGVGSDGSGSRVEVDRA